MPIDTGKMSMKMKKYLAPSMKDGLELMRRELGEDAIILSTRTVKTPEGDIVEIVATNEEQPAFVLPERTESSDVESEKEPTTPVRSKRSSSAKRTDIRKKDVQIQAQSSDVGDSVNLVQLRREIAEMRSTLDTLSDAIRYRHSATLGKLYNDLYKRLRNAELSEDESLRYIGLLASRGPFASIDEALRTLRMLITEHLRVIAPLEPKSLCTTALFVGTTGSGKTITIAKLAAVCKLLYKANVLIISADTYKVGGTDQLQTFASIAGIPFEVAYNSQELRQIIKQEKVKRDIILIDTVGRSQRDKKMLLELAAYKEAAMPEVTYLVQSATVNEHTFLDVMDKFTVLTPDALILTKIDEAVSLGAMVGILRKQSLPLAYFTTGQGIPDDIEPADVERIGAHIIPDM